MYSLCFEDPYTNGGYAGLILVKIGQKNVNYYHIPKQRNIFVPKKGREVGGVKCHSEFFRNFIHLLWAEASHPFSVCLARSSQSCMICQSSVRAAWSCLEQKLLCWFLRISDAQRTQTSCNLLWLNTAVNFTINA